MKFKSSDNIVKHGIIFIGLFFLFIQIIISILNLYVKIGFINYYEFLVDGVFLLIISHTGITDFILNYLNKNKQSEINKAELDKKNQF